ncbi:magnesium-dependent phosphatase 1-like [Harmonia axyridis]|uniref:magnesium-dependent phosphatase 1-like n=1 Tax=Harmonia axyridis TaxID=115357 RepID=UPI001E277FA7|nr:magnesium-dependent phosphatase 1-like [Harmonia axyridis]XP_045469014.1 magnesium-dependent phosphatase 1-like [Harmonia axyridis]XP_045469015.1 magnesium-dependent phosphatase 1-like [Harmonia axyridis]
MFKIGGNKPILIVFDLDFTLWPFWVDTHYSPPFEKRPDGTVVDKEGKTIKPFPQSTVVLKSLIDNGIQLGVASRTSEIQGAKQLIDFFDWSQYFSFVEIFPGCKTTHFERIRDQSGVAYKDMLFFDDEGRNIKDVEKMGVVSHLVKNGMNKDVVLKGIKKFNSAN